jgi:hypothetical protein
MYVMSREEALYLIKLIFIIILYIKVHPNYYFSLAGRSLRADFLLLRF